MALHNCACGKLIFFADWRLCRDCFSEEYRAHDMVDRITSPRPHTRYPFAEMTVDEARVIDRPRNNVAAAATQYGLRHGKKFTVHKIDDNRCRLTRIA